MIGQLKREIRREPKSIPPHGLQQRFRRNPVKPREIGIEKYRGSPQDMDALINTRDFWRLRFHSANASPTAALASRAISGACASIPISGRMSSTISRGAFLSAQPQPRDHREYDENQNTAEETERREGRIGLGFLRQELDRKSVV